MREREFEGEIVNPYISIEIHRNTEALSEKIAHGVDHVSEWIHEAMVGNGRGDGGILDEGSFSFHPADAARDTVTFSGTGVDMDVARERYEEVLEKMRLPIVEDAEGEISCDCEEGCDCVCVEEKAKAYADEVLSVFWLLPKAADETEAA